MNNEGSNQQEAQRARDETVLELMKQLITLGAGVLALSATFIERLRDAPSYLLVFLAVSWLALITSVFFALQTIATIVQSRLNPEEDVNELTDKITSRARISNYGFLAGISLFATFAFVSLLYLKQHEQASGGVQVVITSEDKK